MKEPKFEWYVLNGKRQGDKSEFTRYPYTGETVVPWNIFDNVHVYEQTLRLCQRYKTFKMSFEEFKEELNRIIMHEEWSRCEYEIFVADWYDRDTHKIDAYQQVLPNLDILARYVLTTYYPRLKL